MKPSRIVVAGLVAAGVVVGGSFLASSPAVAANDFASGRHVRAVDGCNIYRFENTLVMYTRASGPVSPTNEYGYEVAVSGGKVVAVLDGVGGLPIPEGGAVISGHGEERRWLIDNTKLGGDAKLPECTTLPHPSNLGDNTK